VDTSLLAIDSLNEGVRLKNREQLLSALALPQNRIKQEKAGDD